MWYRDTRILGYTNTEIQSFLNTRLQGYRVQDTIYTIQDTGIKGTKDTWYRDAGYIGLQDYKDKAKKAYMDAQDIGILSTV